MNVVDNFVIKPNKHKKFDYPLCKHLFYSKFRLLDSGIVYKTQTQVKSSIEVTLDRVDNDNQLSHKTVNDPYFKQMKRENGDVEKIDNLEISSLYYKGLILHLSLPHRIGKSFENSWHGFNTVTMFYCEHAGLYMPQIMDGSLESISYQPIELGNFSKK